MIVLSIDRSRSILLAHASGALTDDDLSYLDTVLRAFVDWQGPVRRSIFDLCEVAEVRIVETLLATRTVRSPVRRNETRIYVAPTERLDAVCRRFAGTAVGGTGPVIVRSLDLAYRLLAVDSADFHPI